MNELSLNQLSDAIAGSFYLSQSSFQKIVHLAEGQTISLLVLLAIEPRTEDNANLAAIEMPSAKVEGWGNWLVHQWQGIHQMVRLGSIFLGMLLLFAIVAILMRPIYQSVFGWHESLPK
ncbi:MAG: hypothetical protein DCF20_20100 [Pseudanabaena sp.]|nr:MAG: hypothetical protein DCF20_20100 [Pseudanabaena sp.]